MAFDIDKLGRAGGSNSNAPTFWTYTTTDTQATLNTTGYFNSMSDVLQVGDLIYAATSTGGTAVYSFYIVLSNSAGVVDVSNGDDIAVTDSD